MSPFRATTRSGLSTNLRNFLYLILLSWVYDHVLGKSVKGFKLLTLGWGDGVSFVPLDFILRAATESDKLVCGITKEMNHHCCGYRRRQEALHKATELLTPLLKRAKARGIWADYLLMDSWFAFPKVLAEIHELLPVICRAKDLPTISAIASRDRNSA